jgi:hypothetical protein
VPKRSRIPGIIKGSPALAGLFISITKEKKRAEALFYIILKV